MNRDVRTRIIRNAVDQTNSLYPHPVLALSGTDSQWQRGNASVIRTEVGIATLSINIQASGFLVGCDGVKRGINDYLKRSLPFNSKNTQNERYKCDDSAIKDVIEHYASIKI